MNYKEQITTSEKKAIDLDEQLQGQQQANEFIGCNTDINILEFHTKMQKRQGKIDKAILAQLARI